MAQRPNVAGFFLVKVATARAFGFSGMVIVAVVVTTEAFGKRTLPIQRPMNPQPLEVLPYDGVFRCLVRSAKNPKRTYLVDLEAYGGVGKCTCHHFEFRLEPRLSRLPPAERRTNPSRWYCKHLKAARHVRALELLDAIMAMRAEKLKR